MAITAALAEYLNTSKEFDLRFLLELSFEYIVGSPEIIRRYVTDNAPLLYDGNTYVPYPMEVKEVLNEVNKIENSTDITLFDPNDISSPGFFKELFLTESFAGRSSISIKVIFADIDPNTGNPFYEDTANTIEVFNATVDSGTASEDLISVKAKNLSDIFKAEIPKVKYSFTCPYTTGDANCGLVSSNECSVSYVDGNLLVVRPNTVNPTKEKYFVSGVVNITSGPFKGVLAGVKDSTRLINPSEYRLLLDTDLGFTGSTSFNLTFSPNCTRQYTDCRDRFDNEDKFGGFTTAIKTIGGVQAPIEKQSASSPTVTFTEPRLMS